jgi:hypothetical protein
MRASAAGQFRRQSEDRHNSSPGQEARSFTNPQDIRGKSGGEHEMKARVPIVGFFWGDAARLTERVRAAGSKVLDSLAHEGEPGRLVALLVPQEGKLNL